MILRSKDLVKIYGRREVVRSVSLEVHQGEIVGLLGPNGAGKTTTFYMVVGFIKPNEGQVFLEGEDITDLPMYKRAKRGIGYLPQEPSVFRKLSVEDNVKAVLEMTNLSKDEQRERLQERIDDPRKRWKANPADLEERKRWDDYQAAYEEALAETSTEQAPWYVIPANANWYRNLVISRILVDLLEGLSMRYPEPAEGIPDMRVV